MREAMDNFLNSLLSSPSWSDMNESASRSWVGSCSQTDDLLADSIESFQVDRKNSDMSMMPSSKIIGNVTVDNLAMADNLTMAQDNISSIFTDGSLKYGISEGPFLTGNLSQTQQPNHNSHPSHSIETSEKGFSILGAVTCNSAAIPYGLELSSSLPYSALTNPSSLESSGSGPPAYVHSIGEAQSLSSVPILWPAPYSGISSLSGQEKAENFSFQGISTGVDLLTKGSTEPTSLQLSSFSGVSQMSLTKTDGMQTNPQFDGNSLKHQLGHSSNSHLQMTQANNIGCNVTAKPRVRARRGQATDPHSIAERQRREKIAERMKNLQELIPNSNKTDKASMLDEIIDYVKFLQLQVKVLSMSRLGAAGAVVPLITDFQAEDTRNLNLSSSVSQVEDLLDSEENLAFEQEVVKLMEFSVTNAMQYLQNKGFCLMPIALATAISNQKGFSAAALLDQRKQDASESNDRNNEANHRSNGMIIKQEVVTTSMCNGR